MVSLDMLDNRKIPPFLQALFQVDGIVFASGYTKYGLLTEHTPEDISGLWKIHMETPLLLIKALQEKLQRSQNSRIVFIGSVYGIAGSSMETVYSAVKGAQQSFVKAYGKEVATLGITVNCIAPGAVATQMNHSHRNRNERVETRYSARETGVNKGDCSRRKLFIFRRCTVYDGNYLTDNWRLVVLNRLEKMSEWPTKQPQLDKDYGKPV